MSVNTIRALMLRELRALRREIEAYPNEADLWVIPPGIANSAGNLAFHAAGNIQHFIGARLGETGYTRNRELEFSRRNGSRADMLRELDSAIRAVENAFGRLSDADLAKPYPEEIAKATVSTGEWLMHLAVHLGYHLGQVDYHRRLVTGDVRTMDGVSVRELPSVVKAAGLATSPQ